MRRISRMILMVVSILVLAFTMCSCGGSASIPAEITGDWNCQDTASDNETATGFYHMTIGSDGYFSIFDIEAGNPGIAGEIKSASSETADDGTVSGSITVTLNQDDFDPPLCWDMKPKDTLNFTAGNGHLELEHNGVSLFFTADNNDMGGFTYTPLAPETPTAFADYTLTYRIDSNGEEWGGTPILDIERIGEEKTTSLPLCEYVEYAKDSYIMDDGTNQYVLIQMGYSNDWTEIAFVKLDGANSYVTDTPIPFSVAEYTDGGFSLTLRTKVDVLGSYGGVKTFYVRNDQLVTDDDDYAFLDEDGLTLTVKKDFKAFYDDGSEMELKAGDVITPTGSNYKDKFYFLNEEGFSGYIEYDSPEGNSIEYKINGIDQYELFENLPYAG